MTDAGFFKGTSAEQDARFSDKKKKLMKTMKFGENLSQKVDMTRVNLDCIKPWIIRRITELLNFEDEVVWDYILNQLDERYPDPKEIQINITGFLNSKNARIFLSELWDLLLSAMQNPEGVPAALVEAKKAEIANRQLDERQVQMEIRRKQEELKIKATAAQMSTITGSQQSSLPPRTVPNGSNLEVPDSQSRVVQPGETRAVHSISAAPTPEGESRVVKRSTPEKDDDRKRHHKEKHHHRSRSASSKSYSGTDDDVDTHRRSRHRNRSRSIEADVKKPTNPDSDWRKDLMAGRRRSPPTMPENSYYGFEKRRREHKRSRHRRKSSESEDDHRTRHSHSRSSRRREDSPIRRPRGDSPRDYRQYDRRSGKHREYVESVEDTTHKYREKHRRRDSRTPTPVSSRTADPVCANPADRANRFHDRRAQWAQEEDEFRTHGASETSGKQSRQKHLAVSNRRQRQPSDTVESRTPEGPNLPQPPKEPSRHEPQRQVQKVPSTSSSSSGSGSECSSSDDDDDDSSSSSGSSSSKSEEVAQIPEGPPLPPGSVHQPAEPEGPALPLTSIAGASTKRKVSHATSSTSSSDASGSESDEEEDGSDSSSGSSSTGSGDSSDGSSEPGDEDEVNKSLSPPVKRRRGNMDTERASSEVKRRERIPEGPAVPENYVSKSDQRRYPDSGHRKPSERQRDSRREDSAEEALRRRALASLIQASGKKHRRDSRSP